VSTGNGTKKTRSHGTASMAPLGPPIATTVSSEVQMKPVPITLHWSAITRLIGPILAVLVSFGGAGIYFYHRTTLHIENQHTHLSAKDRDSLQTREQAREQHTALLDRFSIEMKAERKAAAADRASVMNKVDRQQDQLQRQQRQWDRLRRRMSGRRIR